MKAGKLASVQSSVQPSRWNRLEAFKSKAAWVQGGVAEKVVKRSMHSTAAGNAVQLLSLEPPFSDIPNGSAHSLRNSINVSISNEQDLGLTI
jgi:hypothetical protein